VVTHTRKYTQAAGKIDKYKKELAATKELVKSLSGNLQVRTLQSTHSTYLTSPILIRMN